MNRDQLCADLERDEGLRLKPYLDSVGVLTIGIGRNLQDVGITKAEAYMLLGADIDTACGVLDRNLPWWRDLSEARQRAVVNMCFNLGITRLLGFSKALAALKAGQYEEAARQFLDSRWATQVGQRAQRIAELIRKG
jgi:lysozyme